MDPLLGMVKKEPRFWVEAKHPLAKRILNVDRVVFLLLFRISLGFGWFLDCSYYKEECSPM